MKISYWLSISTAIALLSGCGGSSTNTVSTITGQFIDSAVEGLEYSCSSGTNGITNTNGDFTCNVGDTVTFSINGFEIGSATADTTITPKTLQPTNDEAMTNIAQLLQTLDSDNNPDNGITIDKESAAVKSLANIEVALNKIDFDSVITSHIGKTLVDAVIAKNHLDLSIENIQNSESKVEDTADVTKLSAVSIYNNVTQDYCSTQSSYEISLDGYSNYAEFISAGGTINMPYYNTTKDCSEYSNAGFCDVGNFIAEDKISGTGSCVQIITFPASTNISNDTSKYTNNITSVMGSKTWLPSRLEEMSPDSAISYCKSLGARLPTLEEFVEANNNDIDGFTRTQYIIDKSEFKYGYTRYKIATYVGSRNSAADKYLEYPSRLEEIASGITGAYARCIK